MAYLDNVTNILQIQPDGLPTYVRLSQNENGRNLYFELQGNEIDIPSNATVTISGTKPDGTVYSGTGSVTDNVVLIPEMLQMTAVAGTWDAKIQITSGGNTIATGRVRFVVDADTVAPGSVPSDSELEGLVAQAQQYAETARTEAYGSPLTASTAAGMTDHTRVYVYTGSESGYTAGHWYFWNGSAWTDGGIYNSVAVNTDPTLKLSGVAADAKATGDAIAAVTIPTDKTLSVSDAPADAKVVGDELDSLKGDLSDLSFDTVFGMGFINGDMNSAGALITSTKWVRTNAPIKLFAGDEVVCNSPDLKFGIRKFTGPDVADYDGFERAASSYNYIIKNTGWYIIIAGYVDSRVIDDSNRGIINNNVYVKRTLSCNVLFNERQTNYFSAKEVHPFSSVQGDDGHAGINQDKTRFTTVAFRIKNNTIISIPSGLKMLVRKCYDFNSIQCQDIVMWITDNATIDNAEYINITFGKTDDSEFTESEIESALKNIKFGVKESSGGGGDEPQPFTSTVTFRYDRKTINASGVVVSESPLKHAVINVPVRFIKGDLLKVVSNTYKFAVYKYSDHAGTTFQGIVKSDSSADYTVANTGYYRVLLSYSDERTIATATEMLDVFMLERTIDDDTPLTERENNTLPDNYLFPYSSTGVTEMKRGINGSPNRIHTIPFKVVKGTTITFSEDTDVYMYITYSDLNTLHSTYASAWLTDGSLTFTEDTYISLGFGTSESSYTDQQIASEIADTKFTTKQIGAIVNVQEVGAVGDGVTDDTAAIQSALNSGGTIYFPAGTYKVTTHLILYSNTHLMLDEGATILRAGEYNMMFISNCTDETLAYNGVQNIVIEGGTLDNGTEIAQGGAILGLIHCENVTVRNVICKHNNGTYHFFDICGCKDVLIDKCIFKDSLTTSEYAELIQFDAAESRNAFPSPQLTAGANTFDLTIDQNIEVRGCTFELNSYSPAFGNHNSQPNKNINIHDNIITGTGGSRGAVAFDHTTRHDNVTTQVLIHHNIFEGCTYGFNFNPNGTGKIYVRDNLLKSIGTLKVNPDSPVGEFLNNIELT